MNNIEIRKRMIPILDEVNISELRSVSDQQDFINGELDLAFDEMDMDSLFSMELCIAIELELGVSIVPEQLNQLRSLQGLVQKISTNLS